MSKVLKYSSNVRHPHSIMNTRRGDLPRMKEEAAILKKVDFVQMNGV
jgi:hypothetical protein